MDPVPGTCWWHLIFNARGTWLPGDPRGFRSRNHRKHSTGDYKRPPPRGEHAGLHRHIRGHSGAPVRFPKAIRAMLAEAVLQKAESDGAAVLVLSVDAHHVHLLTRLGDDRDAVVATAGRWKQAASHRVREVLPGRIWSHSGDPIRVKDRAHHLSTFHYIRGHVEQGAWVWVNESLLGT